MYLSSMEFIAQRRGELRVNRKTRPEVIATLDRLLETHADQQAADALDALGYRNWQQQPFNAKKVIRADVLAKRFGVSVTTIHDGGRQRLLRRQRYDNNVRCMYEPVDSVMIQKGQGGPVLLHEGSRALRAHWFDDCLSAERLKQPSPDIVTPGTSLSRLCHLEVPAPL
jgi:hypothetical protein